MGYDIHITRQENWFDENSNLYISMDEWLDFVENDPDMRLDNFAEATTTSGDNIRIESKGLSVWTKYSGDGLDGNHAWFDYFKGAIIVKNPDEEIVNKMLDVAKKLNARVIGDDGEIYERSGEWKITQTNPVDNSNTNAGNETKNSWWKFW